MYSTCSLNPIEDEAVVGAALAKCGGAVELVEAKLPGEIFLWTSGVNPPVLKTHYLPVQTATSAVINFSLFYFIRNRPISAMVKDNTNGAIGLRFDSQASQIGHLTYSPSLRCDGADQR